MLLYNLTLPETALLLAAGLVAATLAAVSGFGGAAILLPILTAIFDLRVAVPILTVAQLIGNASRVVFNYRAVHLPIVGWYTLGAVPFAIAGGVVFASAPLPILTRVLGLFLLAIVAWRRLTRPRPRPFPIQRFAWIGAGFSFLSAIVGSVGPVMAPFFLAFGLAKSAYIGTEALATVVMHITKLVVYRQMSVLSFETLTIGLMLGPVMILGSWIGKRIVDHLPERVFILLIELAMAVAGLLFLIRG